MLEEEQKELDDYKMRMKDWQKRHLRLHKEKVVKVKSLSNLPQLHPLLKSTPQDVPKELLSINPMKSTNSLYKDDEDLEKDISRMNVVSKWNFYLPFKEQNS